MLKSLYLENFKAFGQPTHIELAPITLIFGQNSSGKSSILQSLNLLKQTREGQETGAALLPRGQISDLGSFQELLFDHDLSRSVEIGVEVDIDESPIHPALRRRLLVPLETHALTLQMSFCRPTIADEISVNQCLLNAAGCPEPLIEFRIRTLKDEEKRRLRGMGWSAIGARRGQIPKLQAAQCARVSRAAPLWSRVFDSWKQHQGYVVEAIRRMPESDDFTLDSEDEHTLWTRSVDDAIRFYMSDFGKDQFVQRVTDAAMDIVMPLDGFLPEGPRLAGGNSLPETRATEVQKLATARDGPLLPWFDVVRITNLASRSVDQALASLFPLGPYRRPPDRWYIFTGTTPDDVGYGGDKLPDLLFRRPDLVERGNQWLRRLELGYSLKVDSVGDRTSDLFEVRLLDLARNAEIDVALSDVGFGISQILPFLVQTLAAERQIISVEQPEVHIHPRLQADLGDLVAETISEPYFHQFLIETHSEHLVLRLLRLVREGQLRSQDLAIIHVARGPGGSTAQRLLVDEDGDFVDEWPGGFFPERQREIF